MYIKKIYSIAYSDLKSIGGNLFLIAPETDQYIFGIEVNQKDISNDLYDLIASLRLPYVLVIDLPVRELQTHLNDKEIPLAELVVPLLMHYTQYHHFFHKVLLIKTDEYQQSQIAQWHELLLKKLAELGLRNIAAYYSGIGPVDGRNVYAEIYPRPAAGPYPLNWEVSLITQPCEFADLITDSVSTIQDKPDYQLFQREEEIARLKETNETLLKNIYDLNKYYRYVRGETVIKYNNRENGDGQSPDPLAESAKRVAEYKKRYTQAYDRLPSWYKKIGTLLKIILLRRELRYYVNKKHKKIFFDMLYSLPSEKQIKTWYYYEYEILPAWYRWVGKLL